MRTARGWRILPLVCALLGASLWAVPLPVAAAFDHVITCAGNGSGSLPDVVAHATANDTVVFDRNCWDATAIMLTRTITIGVNLTIDATSPLHDAMIDGGGTVTVFKVNSGVTATLRGLTIQHGFGGASGGGGIRNSGTLTVEGLVFSANTAVGAAGIGGGAIRNDDTLIVAGSSFGGFGFPGNSASSGPGGGIANYRNLTVTGSSFGGSDTSSGNSAGNGHMGGAIYDNGVTLAVTNSTFTRNAAGSGGAIGIDTAARTASVTNSTISGNTAAGSGGGIYTVSIPPTVTNTIIADVNGIITSGGHNLISTTAGSSGWVASDLTGVNPNLSGPTGAPLVVLSPMSGSLAIGAGDASVCRQTGPGTVNAVDELGQPRLPSTCDIGAYQMQGTHLVASVPNGPTPAGTPITLTVRLFDGYGNLLTPYTGTVHFTSSDPRAVLPADYSFTGKGSGKDNAAHSFTITFLTAGTQTVTVTDTLGDTLTGQGTAAITPVVSTVTPSSGSTMGGNHITLTGLGFGATGAIVAVSLGGSPAPVTGMANTQLVVTAPPHAAGVVDMIVTVNGQATTMVNGYTYGIVTALPGPLPSCVTGAAAVPLPSARPSSVSPGTPSPLPLSRP
jgi:hypothetical protein